MPFKSEKQRKWMWANEPEMAEKWANEEDEIEEGIMKITKRQLRRIIKEERARLLREYEVPHESQRDVENHPDFQRGYNDALSGRRRRGGQSPEYSVGFGEGTADAEHDKAETKYIREAGREERLGKARRGEIPWSEVDAEKVAQDTQRHQAAKGGGYRSSEEKIDRALAEIDVVVRNLEDYVDGGGAEADDLLVELELLGGVQMTLRTLVGGRSGR